MGYELVVRKNADHDARKAIDYYFAISADLAARFLEELNATLNAIATTPQYYKYLSAKKKQAIGARGSDHFHIR